MARHKEDIDGAIKVIKDSIEKKIAENTEIIVRAEIEETLKKTFLEALSHKVEQISSAKVVSTNWSEHYIGFSCEIPKINLSDTQTAHQVIKAIDEVNLEYFFKKKTKLHIFNFCSKYFMFSQFCNSRQVNLINFNWSKNKFNEKQICYCFMCKFNLELAEDQEKAEQEK